MKYITSCCISDSDRLNKCLRVLIRKGWIKAFGKPKYYLYRLTPKFYHDCLMIRIINNLKTWKKESVITDRIFDYKLKSKGYSVPSIYGIRDITWNLFGITPDILDTCNNWEIADLHRTIRNLVNEVKKIAMFKITKAGLNSFSDFLYQEKSIDDFCCVSLYINVNPMLAPDHYFPKDIEEAFENIKLKLKENKNGINNIEK
jgi:hypothetical protein